MWTSGSGTVVGGANGGRTSSVHTWVGRTTEGVGGGVGARVVNWTGGRIGRGSVVRNVVVTWVVTVRSYTDGSVLAVRAVTV